MGKLPRPADSGQPERSLNRSTLKKSVPLALLVMLSRVLVQQFWNGLDLFARQQTRSPLFPSGLSQQADLKGLPQMINDHSQDHL